MSAFTNRFDYCPWLFWRQADSEQRGAQLAHQADLIASGIVVFGEHCFVSPLAGLVPARLSLGDRAYIAAHAYVTGDVAIGADSTVNPFATVRGKVSLGNGVRIGAHASVLGFNHRSDDLLRPIHTQGLETRGIVVDDDVWIGSGALLLDGVRVGSHSIVAAGAVVTKDVPAYAVVAGNPARVLRDRRAARVSRRPGVEAPTLTPDPAMPPSHPSQSAHVLSASPWLASASSAPVRATQAADVAATLHAFGRRVAAQWPEVLARCEATVNGERRFVDAPGQRPRMFRPNCDAIEIAAAFGAPPPLMQADRWIEVLQATQDAASGLPIDPWRPNHPAAPLARLGDGHTRYQILAIGHALECLGAHLAQPIRAVHDMPPDQLVALLNRLPWREHAWQCGAWVDSFATGLWMNRRDFGLEGPIVTLFDWLRGACRPNTGLWGESADGRDWLQPVNGFYRLTRGSYAQFDLRVPYPESTVDTVLAHIRLNDGFIERRVDACNLLDTVHPLWLMLQHTEHRRVEALRYIEAQIGRICARWQDGRGFGFAPQDEPGLKGTEMGLAIVHIAADALGLAHELPYRPRGVHRLRS